MIFADFAGVSSPWVLFSGTYSKFCSGPTRRTQRGAGRGEARFKAELARGEQQRVAPLREWNRARHRR